MVYTKVHFDLPGSLGKKENIKEYLIVLDAFDKTKYLGFFFSGKTNIFTAQFQTESTKRY